MKRRAAVIAYDISKNKIRRQVHRTLMEWRIDGQKSVAECALTTAEADELCLQLLDLIDPITDRLALVWLDTGQTIERWGKATTRRPRGVLLH